MTHLAGAVKYSSNSETYFSLSFTMYAYYLKRYVTGYMEIQLPNINKEKLTWIHFFSNKDKNININIRRLMVNKFGKK